MHTVWLSTVGTIGHFPLGAVLREQIQQKSNFAPIVLKKISLIVEAFSNGCEFFLDCRVRWASGKEVFPHFGGTAFFPISGNAKGIPFENSLQIGEVS